MNASDERQPAAQKKTVLEAMSQAVSSIRNTEAGKALTRTQITHIVITAGLRRR